MVSGIRKIGVALVMIVSAIVLDLTAAASIPYLRRIRCAMDSAYNFRRNDQPLGF